MCKDRFGCINDSTGVKLKDYETEKFYRIYDTSENVEKFCKELNVLIQKNELNEQLIQALNDKIKDLNGLIDDLSKSLKQKNDEIEVENLKLTESKIEYWKGIEKVYEKELQECKEKNNALNRENELMLHKIEELEERIAILTDIKEEKRIFEDE